MSDINLLIRDGRLDELKKVRDTGYHFDEMSMCAAGLAGQLEIIKWLHGIGVEVTPISVKTVVTSGDTRIMDWFLENDKYNNDNSINITIGSCNNIKMLEWLDQHGHIWSPIAILSSEVYENLPVLTWLLWRLH